MLTGRIADELVYASNILPGNTNSFSTISDSNVESPTKRIGESHDFRGERVRVCDINLELSPAIFT